MKRLLSVIVCLIIMAACGEAGEITLAWNASASTGVTGYKLHYGTASGSYGTVTDVGGVLTFKVTELTLNQNYCFVATAYDAEGNESGYSNEVCGLPTRTIRTLAAPVLRIP